VAFHTTVSKCKTTLYIFAQGIHPQISIISIQSVLSKTAIQRNHSLTSTSSMNLPSGFEVTSFLADPENGIFLLGSRQGALACYSLSSSTLIGIWRRIHDQESVRSIRLHKTSPRSTEILTTGRNWAYNILRIQLPEDINGELPDDIIDGSINGVELQYIHRSNLNRGWLEGVFSFPNNLI
jgi:hypothetical protein